MTDNIREKQRYLNTLSTVSEIIQSCSILSKQITLAIQNVKGAHAELYTLLRQMYNFSCSCNYIDTLLA